MAFENEQLRRLEQATIQQNNNIGRFNSSVASLLQQSNKNVEKTVDLNSGTSNNLSKYFQTSIKIQTEQTNILRQIAEILTASNNTKKGGREDFLRSASKQGMEFDISREMPRKGFFGRMWNQSAKATIDKKVKDTNRKLARSMGLSMSLTAAITTPASTKFRGIVAENELDFNIVQTNVLMGMYELQRFSLMQLVDINKSTSKDKSSSVTEQQRRLESSKTDRYTSDFDPNEDPRTFMQKVGNVPFFGGMLQTTLAPIKELLTLPSLPNRLKKWWGDYKEESGLQKKDKTQALKETNLYRSNQDRAYDFLGGEFITIIERMRADVAAVRYSMTGEKPGTDPKTGISLTKSREDVYDSVFGKFIEAQRDEKGKITQSAAQKKFQLDEIRKSKIEQYYQEQQQGSIVTMAVAGVVNNFLPKFLKDKLGIEDEAAMIQGSIKAMGDLNEAEYENAEWLRQQNETYPKLIEQQDMFSTLLGVGVPALAGLATVLTGGGASLGIVASTLGVKGTLLAGAAASGGVVGALGNFINSFTGASKQLEIEKLQGAQSQEEFLKILKEQGKDEDISKRYGDLKNKFRGIKEEALISPTQTTNTLLSEIKQQLIEGITIRSYVADANGVPINLQYLADFFKENYISFTKTQQELLIHQDSIIPEPVYLVEGPSGKLLTKHAKGGISRQGIVAENEKPELMGGQIIKSPTVFSSNLPQKITGEDETATILKNLSVTIDKLSLTLDNVHKDKILELQDKKELSVAEQIKLEADNTKAKDEAEDRDLQLKETKETNENISQLLGVISPWYKMEKKNDEEEKKKQKKGFFSTLFSFLGSPLKLLPMIGGVLASIGGVAKTVGALTGTTSTLLKLGLVLAPVVKGIASGIVSLLNYFGLHPIVELGKKAVKGTGTLFGKIKDLFTKKGVGTVAGDVAGAAAKGAASEAAGTAVKGVAKKIHPMAAKMAQSAVSNTAVEGVVGQAASSTLGTGLFKNKSLAKFLPKVGLKSIAKIAGPLLIVDGLIEMFNDYRDTGSIMESVFGNMKGGLSDAFKGMGKYGAMGATIGLVGGPIGMGIGALIGSAIGGLLGLFGTDNLKSMDAFKARTGEFNQSISQFFIDHFGKYAARGAYFFADSPIPIIPPILGGLVGSVADGIVGIFSGIGKIAENFGPFLDSANTAITDFFTTTVGGKYGSRMAAFFSDSIPVIGPLLGGLVGSMVDGVISIFSFAANIAEATGPLLNSINGSIIGFFKDYSGEYSVKFATTMSGLKFPGLTLLGGLVGTAVDGIAALIGSISNFNMDSFITSTLNMNDALVNMFKGEYSNKFADKSRTIPFIGPLLGGISGMIFDFINAVFFDHNLDDQFKLFAAEIVYFFEDIKIAFKKKVFFAPFLNKVIPDSWKKDIEEEEKALQTKKQEIEQLKQAVKMGTWSMEQTMPSATVPLPKASELPDTSMPAGTPSAPPSGMQGAAVGAWNAAKSGVGAAWNTAKSAASATSGYAQNAWAATKDLGTSLALPEAGKKKLLSFTTGNWRSGFTDSVRGAIQSAAQKIGVPFEHLLTMAWIESRGDPKAYNKGSGASGLFQFIPSTWRAYASKLGLSDPFDPYQNSIAGASFLKENMGGLSKAGIEPSIGNLYLAHQQGLGGIKSIYNAAKSGTDVSAKIRKNMDSNAGQGLSPSQFVSMWQTIGSKVQAKVAGVADNTSSGQTMVASLLDKGKQLVTKFNPMGTAQASDNIPSLPTGGMGPLNDQLPSPSTTPIGIPSGPTAPEKIELNAEAMPQGDATKIPTSETEGTDQKPVQSGAPNSQTFDISGFSGWGSAEKASFDLLAPEMAGRVAGLAKDYEKMTGKKVAGISKSDMYRTYQEQVATKAKSGVNAATPGMSAHGLGLAVDFGSGYVDWAKQTTDPQTGKTFAEKWGIATIVPDKKRGGVERWHITPSEIPLPNMNAIQGKFRGQSGKVSGAEVASGLSLSGIASQVGSTMKGVFDKAKGAAVGAYQTVKHKLGFDGTPTDTSTPAGMGSTPINPDSTEQPTGPQGEGGGENQFKMPSKEEIAGKLKAGVSEFGSMIGSFFGSSGEGGGVAGLSDSDKMSRQILYGDANISSDKMIDLTKFGVTPMQNQSIADFTVTNTGLRDSYAAVNSHQPLKNNYSPSTRFKKFIDELSPFNKGVNINSPKLRDQSLLTKQVSDQVADQTGESRASTDQSTTIPDIEKKQSSTAPPVINMPSNINNINQSNQTIEDNFDKKFDADTDKFIWKLLSAVPDLLKQDTYLFGTGIDFGTATNQ